MCGAYGKVPETDLYRQCILLLLLSLPTCCLEHGHNGWNPAAVLAHELIVEMEAML